MMAAAAGHIYTPAKGAFRLRGRGEVDHIRCFSSKTIGPLLERGWIVATNAGCYVATEAGKSALCRRNRLRDGGSERGRVPQDPKRLGEQS